MVEMREQRPQDAEAGLAATDVVAGYHGTAVVHGASIRVHAGEITALVGPNGSGKSTLLRCIARLNAPMGGAVVLGDGASATAMSPRAFARRVAMLTQSRPMPAGLTVADVVAFGRHPHRSGLRGTDPEGPDAVARALRATGLTELSDRPVDELSGGQQQRAWLACCLAQDTGVLLLDEPTTFLDLRYQVEILDLMRDLAADHGTAIGVVLHDLNQAAQIADRVVLLAEGRVRAAGPAADVLTTENLTEAYGIRVDVTTDPVTGHITARPVGRRAERAAAPPRQVAAAH